VPYEEEHEPESTTTESESDEPISATLAALVGVLPPKKRASVLLKDVLEYRLAEVAEVVEGRRSQGGAASGSRQASRAARGALAGGARSPTASCSIPMSSASIGGTGMPSAV